MFELELAGVAERTLAWVIDVMVMAALVTVILVAASFYEKFEKGVAQAFAIVGVFLVQWWYGALFEWFANGQTPGKRALRLRTISADGLRIRFLQSVVRNLMRIVDLIPGLYLAGGMAMLLDGSQRRLGDFAAGTIVVRAPRAVIPADVVPEDERYNSFVNDPLVAHAVRRISPKEREVMVSLSLRREELPIAVRHQLFAELAGHLHEKLGVARPSFFSEEKYVLNLTAVLLRSAFAHRGPA